MKISVAQLKPFSGDVQKNIEAHLRIIRSAIVHKTDLIIFSELSLTGYEPKLARELATNESDARLDAFQDMSNTHHISIAAGLPVKGARGIEINNIIFQPNRVRQTYSKRYLHSDELTYFTEGLDQLYLNVDTDKIALAICYESLIPKHNMEAIRSGATIYLASVAKPMAAIKKAHRHFSDLARQHSIVVAMANAVGHCDDFESAGNSAIWNSHGNLMIGFNNTDQGLLIFDTESEKVIMEKM